MKTSTVVIACLLSTGLSVGFCVLYVDSVLRDRQASEGLAPHSNPTPVVPDEAPARLQGLPDASRLEKLEATVARLETAVAPVIETHSKLMAGDLDLPFADTGITLGSMDRPLSGARAGPTSGMGISEVGQALELNRERRELLETRFDDLVDALEKVETLRGSSEEKDGRLTIRIGAYADEAKRMQQEWHDWLGRNLTAEEWETYRNQHFDAQLLGARLSGQARRVELWDENGSLRFRETLINAGGKELPVMEATAPADARDLLLEPYQHILDAD